MASIKPIEQGSVHKIQSGQVIVDLCSVVKELLENGLDAGATAIDVRFRNHGLDAIEVQDNGSGIPRDDYETIALKHYTSKLSSYDDLSSLRTFGFRGEALSSLCALANVHITTAQDDEAPKGTRLEFETSGRLKGTQVVASQRGTTVSVETIFKNLPVRRQELEKNIKREYGKVLSLLQAYACVTTTARVSASNVVAKGKKAVVFSTKSNQSTRENIANVFGSKTLSALISLDLHFEMQATSGRRKTQEDGEPTFGEGRQTPDRQMFFVNGRPCGLPQVAKVFNEVYKSYNLSHSPFIFADVILNTNAYDVNVSPDKRTILLHDQGVLLESIKKSLTELFERQQQTVPHAQNPLRKLPTYSLLTTNLHEPRLQSNDTSYQSSSTSGSDGEEPAPDVEPSISLIHRFAGRHAQDRVFPGAEKIKRNATSQEFMTNKQKSVEKFAKQSEVGNPVDDYENASDVTSSNAPTSICDVPILDFNQRLAEQRVLPRNHSEIERPTSPEIEDEIPSVNITPSKPEPGIVPNAFDRMRPLRAPAQVATITIGSRTMTSTIGTPAVSRAPYTKTPLKQIIRHPTKSARVSSQFSSNLRSFAAAGTHMDDLAADSRALQAEQSDDEEAQTAVGEAIEDSDTDNYNIFGTTTLDASTKALKSQSPSVGTRTDLEELGVEEDDGLEEPDNADESMDRSDHEDSLYESENEGSDGEYLDDETKKVLEEARVAKLIDEAEATVTRSSDDTLKRAQNLLKGGGRKESTAQLLQIINISIDRIVQQQQQYKNSLEDFLHENIAGDPTFLDQTTSAEDRLSLTVSKEDFTRMRIIGQFNLGFILALRTSNLASTVQSQNQSPSSDELFIIDQHASDEKYNFERLQATTIVQSQRLVHPQNLDLTVIEEETIIDNQDGLLKNGFSLAIDQSGSAPVGQRCKLLSLPMSKEVTFSTRDLEELLVLLAESPSAPTTATMSTPNAHTSSVADWSMHQHIPRPSKVRKMFAMRACRSSVMIGKTLTKPQMGRLVAHMGELEKPWNCPHGRPTMRHLTGLNNWDAGEEPRIDWADWSAQNGRPVGSSGGEEEEEDEGEEEEEQQEELEEEEESPGFEEGSEEGNESENVDFDSSFGAGDKDST